MTEPLVMLPPLHPDNMQVGADPAVMRREVEAIFIDAYRNAPRSLQRAIGPSELGTPCARKLAYRLADAPEHNERDGWRPTVGTATHAWIADALAEYNMKHHDQLGFSRYLIECQVEVGEVNGVPVRGSADCYDRVTGEVIDWKVVGATTLKSVRRASRLAPGISKRGYRVQAHLYGRGFVARGLPVHGVNIAYLPSSGELREAHWQREPYAESIATEAIARADAVARAMEAAGPEVLVMGLPRTDDLCTYCAFWNPAADERFVWDGCTGADLKPSARESLVSQLIGE